MSTPLTEAAWRRLDGAAWDTYAAHAQRCPACLSAWKGNRPATRRNHCVAGWRLYAAWTRITDLNPAFKELLQ